MVFTKGSNLVLAVFVSVIVSQTACAHIHVEPNQIFTGDLQQETFDSLVAKAPPGTVVVFGETHDNAQHHQNQKQFVEAMAAIAPEQKVFLAVEHFPYTQQNTLDGYLQKVIGEDVFLQAVGMKKEFYDFYRDLTLLPQKWPNVQTLAINIPRPLANKIGKLGLDSLSEDERALLPPNLTKGNDKYLERARDEIDHGHHLPPQTIENYLWVQSAWDDTMAWQIAKQMQKNPQAIVIVAVGNFHAAYGGGLPDRLKARGVKRVVTFSQVAVSGMSQQEAYDAIAPSSKYGQLADSILTTEGATERVSKLSKFVLELEQMSHQ